MPPEIDGFVFTLNGEEYNITDYVVEIDPTFSSMRRITANFNNTEDSSEKFRFWVSTDELGDMGQFVYTKNDINYQSNPNLNDSDRTTEITINTESELKGTFVITIRDTFQEPLFVFSMGSFDLAY